MQLQQEIMRRFFQTPAIRKIESDIAKEKEDERRSLEAQLERLTEERNAAMVEPAKKLAAAKAAVSAWMPEFGRLKAIEEAANREFGNAKGLHFPAIRALQKKLAAVE